MKMGMAMNRTQIITFVENELRSLFSIIMTHLLSPRPSPVPKGL